MSWFDALSVSDWRLFVRGKSPELTLRADKMNRSKSINVDKNMLNNNNNDNNANEKETST